jgi:hypothetical protein
MLLTKNTAEGCQQSIHVVIICMSHSQAYVVALIGEFSTEGKRSNKPAFPEQMALRQVLPCGEGNIRSTMQPTKELALGRRAITPRSCGF